MRDQINGALKEAVKAQDKRRISTLRLINAAIQDRDIASRTEGGDPTTNAEILQILATMIKQRRESAKAYEEAGRLELAQQENEEIEIIQSFMPKQLDEGETRQACVSVAEELHCKGLKDMGKIMGALKQRYAGKMDFSKASDIVKELLK